MSTKIDGTNGIIFPDSTTQSTAGLTGNQSQLCKAWVNFNGVSGASIRASYNVSSVVRNSTGNYTVNFTNALSDSNYATGSTVSQDLTTGTSMVIIKMISQTASSVNFVSYGYNGSAADSSYLSICCFR